MMKNKPHPPSRHFVVANRFANQTTDRGHPGPRPSLPASQTATLVNDSTGQNWAMAAMVSVFEHHRPRRLTISGHLVPDVPISRVCIPHTEGLQICFQPQGLVNFLTNHVL